MTIEELVDMLNSAIRGLQMHKLPIGVSVMFAAKAQMAIMLGNGFKIDNNRLVYEDPNKEVEYTSDLSSEL